MKNTVKSVKRPAGVRTWKQCNCVKNLMVNESITRTEAQRRVKLNEQLAIKLSRHGWKFTEDVGIVDDGYTLCFVKDLKSTDTIHGHPLIHFQWHWEHQGGDYYWRAHMYSFFSYQERRLAKPWAMFEIRDITDASIDHLDTYEGRVRSAINSQIPIYGD